MDIFSMFKDFTIVNAKMSSLNILNDYLEDFGFIQKAIREELIVVEHQGLVSLTPMELQAFKLGLRTYK